MFYLLNPCSFAEVGIIVIQLFGQSPWLDFSMSIEYVRLSLYAVAFTVDGVVILNDLGSMIRERQLIHVHFLINNICDELFS